MTLLCRIRSSHCQKKPFNKIKFQCQVSIVYIRKVSKAIVFQFDFHLAIVYEHVELPRSENISKALIDARVNRMQHESKKEIEGHF